MELTLLQQISPFVRLAHVFEPPPRFHLPRRQINDHALLYFKRGQGTFMVQRLSFPVFPGTLFVIRPNIVHSFSLLDSTSAQMLNLHFDLVERRDSGKIGFSKAFGTPNRRRRLEMLSAQTGAPDFLPVRMTVDQAATYERLFQTTLSFFSMKDIASKLG